MHSLRTLPLLTYSRLPWLPTMMDFIYIGTFRRPRLKRNYNTKTGLNDHPPQKKKRKGFRDLVFITKSFTVVEAMPIYQAILGFGDFY